MFDHKHCGWLLLYSPVTLLLYRPLFLRQCMTFNACAVIEGLDIVSKLEARGSRSGKPTVDLTITDAGELK
jgi:hypothetical protein